MIEKMLQKDLLVKVAAVILALLIWATVIGIENPVVSKQFSVDLKIEAPEGKILETPNTMRVAITLEGRTHSLEQIKTEDIKVSLDISKAPAGMSTFPIEYVSPYAGVGLLDINPSMVSITLAARESKEVGIAVTVRGTPNKEFTAEKPTYTATTARVIGPKGNVERVQIVAGEIDVTGAVASTTARVTLVPKDSSGNEIAQIQVDPPEIEVTVPMKPKQPAKMVAVKVETTGTPKNGYKLAGVTVSPEYVEIRGSASVTSKIDAIYTRVDVVGREAGFSSAVNLVVPSGVTMETNRVTVNVDIQPDIVTKTFSNVYVQVIDLPIGYTFNIDPAEIMVELSGRSDILAQVKAADVQAFIDAGGISPSEVRGRGDFPLPVYPGDLPAGISILEMSPSRVILTLTKR